MNMLILTLHISVAILMTAATVGVFAAGFLQKETKAYRAMLISFAGTILSGLALLMVVPSGFGRFCAMMTTFTVMTIVARQYYRGRVLVNSSL